MITRVNLSDIEIKLSKHLSEHSFAHSVRTKETALDLAKHHGVDSGLAATSALLHDYAKDLSDSEMLRRAGALGLVNYAVEEEIPFLLHARLGASMVEREFGIEDLRILGAISKHTYGDGVMTDLDRIVYLADAIEPGRSGNGLNDIREFAKTDLSIAFKMMYRHQLQILLEQGRMIHPISIEVWNSLNGEIFNG